MRRRKSFYELSRSQKYRRLRARVESNELLTSEDENIEIPAAADARINSPPRVSSPLRSNASSTLTAGVDEDMEKSTECSSESELLLSGKEDSSSDEKSSSSDALSATASSVQNLENEETGANDNEEFQLKDSLRNWSLEFNIPQNAINKLLKIMKSAGHNDLPKDARTLLQTPKVSAVQEMPSGQYVHYGIERAIVDQLRKKSRAQRPDDDIQIDVHVDGVAISKSSKLQLWPIMGKICGPSMDNNVFFIGAYSSYGKPKSLFEYLEQFCKEYSRLANEGFVLDEQRRGVRIRAVIADAPARSFVTCVKPHNSFYSCGKCIIRGTRVRSRVTYLETDCALRSDEDFQNRAQIEHHQGSSPFEELGLGMVSQFPLDYMHLVCLGVMKKLIKMWIEKKIISKQNLNVLSENLLAVRAYVPKEFTRKCRSLEELDRWKATEFRLFLYVGLVLLQDILPEENYTHFGALSCAIMILSDPVHCLVSNECANTLLRHFVEQMSTLYGEEMVVYNVHNLIHLAQDVKNFGPLDSFSAFPYESAFHPLKRMLRKNEKPLAQLYNRICELSYRKTSTRIEPRDYPFLSKAITEELPMGCHSAHRSAHFENFEISSAMADCCCLLQDGTVIIVMHIGRKNEEAVIIGQEFKSVSEMPHYPCDSKQLDIFVVRELSDELTIRPLRSIRRKMFRIPVDDMSTYVLPLIHTRTEN